MIIVGYERSNFRANDGTEITGYNIYVSREIAPDRGEGDAVDKVYMTDRKLENNNVNVENIYGKEVTLYYNRYGKVERIIAND